MVALHARRRGRATRQRRRHVSDRVRRNVALIGLSTARPSAPFLATGALGETQLQRLGRMLEQTENLLILSFSLSPVCQHIAETFAGKVYPGDLFFHNDVFTLGNQNNDVAAFKPIFHDAELVGWSATKGHQADIGGAVRGGYNPNATEVWQEALLIPAVKVID